MNVISPSMMNQTDSSARKHYKTAVVARTIIVRSFDKKPLVLPIGSHVSVQYAGSDLFMGHFYDITTIDGEFVPNVVESDLRNFVL